MALTASPALPAWPVLSEAWRVDARPQPASARLARGRTPYEPPRRQRLALWGRFHLGSATGDRENRNLAIHPESINQPSIITHPYSAYYLCILSMCICIYIYMYKWICMYRYIYIYTYQHVPHKAVAEVSRILNYRRGSLL